MTILGYIQLSTEVIALVTSVVCFRQLPSRKWLLWIPYLLYTCVVELWGTYLAEVKKEANLWLYNPYIIISIGFYGWFLIDSSILKSGTKKILYAALSIFLLASASWYIIWGDPNDLVSLILNVGSLFICVLCLLFFNTQIRNPLHYRSLTGIPGFWIVCGVLVFYAGISLYTAIYNRLADLKIIVMGSTLQNFIPQVLSLFLYTAITIDIIRCYRLKTY